MKTVVLFLLFLLVGVAVTFGFLFWKAQRKTTMVKNAPAVQKHWPAFVIEQAPSESLKASMQSLSGTVKWQSRVATEAAVITQPRTLQQGEKILTEDDGNVVITFPSQIQINLSPHSELELIQTLPRTIVLQQYNGLIEYQNSTTAIAVRALHLLVQPQNADIAITVDKDEQTVTVAVKVGIVQLGFNDSQSITQEVDLSKGDTYIFDDINREGSLE